jgi:hypothetical protein
MVGFKGELFAQEGDKCSQGRASCLVGWQVVSKESFLFPGRWQIAFRESFFPGRWQIFRWQIFSRESVLPDKWQMVGFKEELLGQVGGK